MKRDGRHAAGSGVAGFVVGACFGAFVWWALASSSVLTPRAAVLTLALCAVAGGVLGARFGDRFFEWVLETAGRWL